LSLTPEQIREIKLELRMLNIPEEKIEKYVKASEIIMRAVRKVWHIVSEEIFKRGLRLPNVELDFTTGKMNDYYIEGYATRYYIVICVKPVLREMKIGLKEIDIEMNVAYRLFHELYHYIETNMMSEEEYERYLDRYIEDEKYREEVEKKADDYAAQLFARAYQEVFKD